MRWRRSTSKPSCACVSDCSTHPDWWASRSPGSTCAPGMLWHRPTPSRWKLLGGHVKPVRAYNSCGLWIQPVEKLADEAAQLVAEGGFSAVKLRIGRDDPAQDLAAARSVKKRVGDKISVMSDFNQRLTV